MQAKTLDIEELLANPRNARTHDERNIEAIAASLEEFGQQKPIVVNAETRLVVAGNGTLEAAKRLGWKTIEGVLTKLAGHEATAFGLSDNRTAELARWDEDGLAMALDQLDEAGRMAAGYTPTEFDNLSINLDFLDDMGGDNDLEDRVRKAIHYKIDGTHAEAAQAALKRLREMRADTGKIVLGALEASAEGLER